jgi:hypothetical protein
VCGMNNTGPDPPDHVDGHHVAGMQTWEIVGW